MYTETQAQEHIPYDSILVYDLCVCVNVWLILIRPHSYTTIIINTHTHACMNVQMRTERRRCATFRQIFVGDMPRHILTQAPQRRQRAPTLHAPHKHTRTCVWARMNSHRIQRTINVGRHYIDRICRRANTPSIQHRRTNNTYLSRMLPKQKCQSQSQNQSASVSVCV